MTTIDEMLAEQKRREQFEQLQQEERQKKDKRKKNLKRLERVAKVGAMGAELSGHPEFAEFLAESGAAAREGRKQDEDEEGAGATRRFGSNVTGTQASKLARSKLGATSGQGAALGGAISGALQGEGVTGIAKTSAAWWWLNVVFGALLITTISVVGILLAILALIYLDFHYIMSKVKKGRGFFITLNWWQKPALMLANLVVIMIPMILFGIFSVATCQVSKDAAFAVTAGLPFNIGTAVTAYMGDYCTTDSQGGRSGGGGASASYWEPSDLVAISGATVDDQTSDPRLRPCMLSKVQQIFTAAQAAGLQITITSAFRSGDFPSRHAYGEAVDIALRPLPSQPWSSNQQIARLVQIAKSAGFNPPTGDTIDEYNDPVERTSGGHVHIEFNRISADASYCASYPNPPAPT